MRNDIHVVLSADDNYARPLAVTMLSVLCNRAEDDALFFHVLDGGITEANRCRIGKMTESKGVKIEFLAVSADLFSGMPLNITKENHVSLATYYRLLIPSIVHAPRCIYMDCDMICRSSLAALWNTQLNDCIAAAVKDIDEDKQSARLGLTRYFNAGLFLMDLDAMRREDIQKDFFHFLEEQHERIVMHDQDVLNCVLDGRIHELDMIWNCQVAKTHKCRESGFYDLSNTARILHFIGHKKPWMWRCNTPKRSIFWTYLQKTPWKESFLCNIIRRITY